MRFENILWKVRNRDCSSRATGSSVFDFEGDGASEVVYADETTFRIFDGRDGTILFEDDSHSSNTRMEMPVVVEWTTTAKARSSFQSQTPRAPGWGDRNLGGYVEQLVRTRRIWNQHTYHVTNIDEDGQVPAVEEPNWSRSRLNNSDKTSSLVVFLTPQTLSLRAFVWSDVTPMESWRLR